jgi:ubiquinone/menaquinone biosynthesis C-methylase UbiE
LGKGFFDRSFAGSRIVSFELTECPLCDGHEHEEIYLARDRHYGIPGVYRIVRCAACSLIFLNPMYSDAELSKLYPSDYYAYQDNFDPGRWKQLVKRLLCYRLKTQDPKFSTPGKMLDLGCGTGWFMRTMRDQGWEAHGVEINESAAALGRKTAGLSIFSGTLKQANFPSGSFDYIRSNHSFEHISCPGETLDEIHRVLKPDGKIMIGVPNVSSPNARFFRQYWWYLGAPVHTFTYSVDTLSRLLRKHRFAIETVTYNSDFSGILGSFQIWLNRKNGRKSTQGMMINNPVLRIPCQWAAKLFDRFKRGDAIEITSVKSEE